MRAMLKSAKLIAVLLALGWAGFAIYLGSIVDYNRIVIVDGYVRVNSRAARSAEAFMTIHNNTQIDDRLLSVAVAADVARVAELHTLTKGAGDAAVMGKAENGLDLPAGAEAALVRGGDHVMLRGLRRGLDHDDEITLTLVFETAGEINVLMKVDLDR